VIQRMDDTERGTGDRRSEGRGTADRRLSRFATWLVRQGRVQSPSPVLARTAFTPVEPEVEPVTRYAPNPYERGTAMGKAAEPPDLDEQLAALREQLARMLQSGELPSARPSEQSPRSWLAVELFGTGEPSWVPRAIFELERPVATLARGGTAPTFVDVGPPTTVMFSNQELTVRPRVLHVLDAIRYEVSRARDEQDLDLVLRRYLGRPPFLLPSRRVVILDPARDTPYLGPVFPSGLDPDLTTRTATYAEAVRTRTKAVPQLAQAPSSRVATAEREKARRPQPACTAAWVERAEGNKEQLRHNRFAAYMVAKLRIPGASPELDYRVWLGGRQYIDYDSFDFIGRTYYEFKTKHEYMPFDIQATWFAMSRIVPQAEEQRRTIARCDKGAQLVWFFDDEAVANAVRPAIAGFVDGVAAVKWNPARMP
jgi:hypothetical protein